MSDVLRDANGTELFVGDEVVLRGKVKSIQQDHILVDCLHKPVREYWFVATQTERASQGPLSLDTEKRQTVAIALAAPEPAAVNETKAAVDSPFERAVAHVMSKGYTRDVAEKIVEEHGTLDILTDQAAEEQALANAKAGLPTLDLGSALGGISGAQNEAGAPTPPADTTAKAS